MSAREFYTVSLALMVREVGSRRAVDEWIENWAQEEEKTPEEVEGQGMLEFMNAVKGL